MAHVVQKVSQRTIALSARLSKEIAERTGWRNVKIFFAMLDGKKLGLFSTEPLCIFLSETLLDCDWDSCLQVALHEMAHYIAYARSGTLEHDSLFRQVCNELGVSQDFSKATVDIKIHSSLLEKVRKLKALSQSPFEAESQSAMRKVRLLMAQYSLEEEDDGEEVYCTDLFVAKAISNKMRVLASIARMETGIFTVVNHTANGQSRLTAYGKREEVEVASYLVEVLERAIDRELRARRTREPGLYYGITGTNSFYDGVLQAVRERIESEKAEGDAASKALVAVQKDNEERARRIVFSQTRLRMSYTRHSRNSKVYDQGHAFGQNLRINRPIEQKEGMKSLPGGQ